MSGGEKFWLVEKPRTWRIEKAALSASGWKATGIKLCCMGFVGKQTKVALALALVALATNVNLDWRLVDLCHLHVGIFSNMFSYLGTYRE